MFQSHLSEPFFGCFRPATLSSISLVSSPDLLTLTNDKSMADMPARLCFLPSRSSCFFVCRSSALREVVEARHAGLPKLAVAFQPFGGLCQRVRPRAGVGVAVHPGCATTRPASPGTFRCWKSPGWIIANGAASSRHRSLARCEDGHGLPAALL